MTLRLGWEDILQIFLKCNHALYSEAAGVTIRWHTAATDHSGWTDACCTTRAEKPGPFPQPFCQPFQIAEDSVQGNPGLELICASGALCFNILSLALALQVLFAPAVLSRHPCHLTSSQLQDLHWQLHCTCHNVHSIWTEFSLFFCIFCICSGSEA